MLKKLNKKIKGTYVVFAFILLLLSIALLAMTRFKIIDIINGPENITSKNLDDYNGKYVEVTLDHPIDYYEYDDKSIGYIIYNEEFDYYYGILFPNSLEDDVDKIIDEVYATPMDASGKNPTPSAFKVRGTIQPLKDTHKDNFDFAVQFSTRDAANKYKLNGSYYIEYNCIDNMDIDYVVQVSIISLIIFVGAIITLLVMVLRDNMKKVNKFIASHDEYDEATINELFKGSEKISSRVYVCKEMTFIATGINGNVILHSEVKNTKDNTEKITMMAYIIYYYKDKSKLKFSLKKKEIRKLKTYYRTNKIM